MTTAWTLAWLMTGLLLIGQKAWIPPGWHLPTTIEVTRDVEIRPSATARHEERGTLYTSTRLSANSAWIRSGERFQMVKIYYEGGCRIRFKNKEYDLNSCHWLPGFSDPESDIYRVDRADKGPRHEDCLPYNPQTLTITYQDARHFWLLSDGHSAMQIFGTEQDANNGLALASRYTEQCFVGRHASTRLPRAPRLVITYWKGATGKQTRISPETCQPYTPSALQAKDLAAAGWVVTDGKRFDIFVDNAVDAEALIALARRFTMHCTIGNGPPPVAQVDYWK